MDLGFSGGIASSGPANNPALAKITEKGASLDINLGQDLLMFSSNIRSVFGGDIGIVSGGAINVGSQETLGRSEPPRGIFAIRHADVSVTAVNDIDINGSRIASYDGGSVTVKSSDGSINAGSGAMAYVRLDVVGIDPQTFAVTHESQAIPGSGIIAATLKYSTYGVGDITVETPKGDILANSGGIVQLALGVGKSSSSMISLKAGTRDAAGNVVHPGSISAENSGVMGQNVDMEAAGDIRGLVIAQQGININAKENVNVTAIAQTGVNIGGATISGNVISVGGAINAQGQSVDATLQADSVNASGSANAKGFTGGNAAGATSTVKQTEEPAKDNTSVTAKAEEEDEKKKKRASVIAVRTKGRVTVILPKS
jgi:hypothetical protein